MACKCEKIRFETAKFCEQKMLAFALNLSAEIERSIIKTKKGKRTGSARPTG